MSQITLPRNVHFIYEHALAQLELRQGYGLDVRIAPVDPWHMEADLNGQLQRIVDTAAYVGTVDGVESTYSRLITPAYRGGEYNRTRSENQYLTHWIYPYKGKFHPQMIRAILNAIGAKPGWTVVDMFSGSGTTLLEAQILGIDSIGIDASPLCVLLARIKTQSWRFVDKIRDAVVELTSGGETHPNAVDPHQWEPNEVAEFIDMARMLTYSDVARRGRDPVKYFAKNLVSMLESAEAMRRAKEVFDLHFGQVKVEQGDCRDLSSVGIAPSTVDAIVTSPPYSIALDYVENDEHALKAMGHDTRKMRKDFIGVRGRGTKQKMAFYASDMKKAFAEMAIALRPAGHAVLVVGDVTVSGHETLTTREMVNWAKAEGLSLRLEMGKIVWGLYNVIKDEKILFFAKEGLR